MKNFKLIVAAIGVTAIVGSALAMNAAVRDDTWCARPISMGTGPCTLTSFEATEEDDTNTHYAYLKTGTTCPNNCTVARDLDPQ